MVVIKFGCRQLLDKFVQRLAVCDTPLPFVLQVAEVHIYRCGALRRVLQHSTALYKELHIKRHKTLKLHFVTLKDKVVSNYLIKSDSPFLDYQLRTRDADVICRGSQKLPI